MKKKTLSKRRTSPKTHEEKLAPRPPELLRKSGAHTIKTKYKRKEKHSDKNEKEEKESK